MERILLGFAILLYLHPISAFSDHKVTILHTNDLHSHFRPGRDALGLGGVARLKTLIDRIKKNSPQALLIDAGDWSEGSIYYNLGAGLESLKMMAHLGYDVTVIGNHDWLNGPDTLLNSFRHAKESLGRQWSLSLIGANLSADDYAGKDELLEAVRPYVIHEVNGVRVAFVGLLTYQFIFDNYFLPVKLTNPALVARRLSRYLKHEAPTEERADIVVLVSHHGVGLNQVILQSAPDADVVIGGHDHKKLEEPLEVSRPFSNPGWIVEAGRWGEYLGKMELERDESGTRISSYELIPVDASIPEDRETLTYVERMEKALEYRYGPIFDDHVGDCEVEMSRDGLESPMGNLVTDAYRIAAETDIALDQSELIYDGLHPGPIRSVDVYNALPAVYDPTSDRSWTIKKFSLKGKMLKRLMGMYLLSQGLAEAAGVYTSGIEVVFQPWFMQNARQQDPTAGTGPAFWSIVQSGEAPSDQSIQSVIHSLKINGLPFDPAKNYTIATGGWLLYMIELVNSWIPTPHPWLRVDQVSDTGIEDWRAVADHIRRSTPLRSDQVRLGGRLTTYGPDLGVPEYELNWQSLGRTKSRLMARVRNFGASPSSGAGQWLRVYANLEPNLGKKAQWVEMTDPHPIPELQPGDAFDVHWDLQAPRRFFPIRVVLNDSSGSEINQSNDEATHWVSQ